MVKNQPKWPQTAEIPDFMKKYLRGGRTQSGSTKESQLSWSFLQVDLSLQLKAVGCIRVKRNPFLMMPKKSEIKNKVTNFKGFSRIRGQK